VRILLVDDHPVVRRGIRSLLEERVAGASLSEAGDRGSAMRLLRSAAYGLVVVDISLPGTNGLELIKEIRREFPQLPTIVLSIHPAAQFARRALAAGAAAYVTKASEPDEVVAAVEAVRQGKTYVSRDTGLFASRMLSRGSLDSLSDREYQVLRMLGAGRSVSSIADELSLSTKTISTYRARLLEKLGLRTNAQLMRYAIENGLTD